MYFFNLIKSICKTTTANIILNSKRLNAFPLRQELDKDVYFYYSYSISYWNSCKYNKARKKNIQI